MRFCVLLHFVFVFFVKQKTAYEMRISDWSSDVCSSDLGFPGAGFSGAIRIQAFPARLKSARWKPSQSVKETESAGRPGKISFMSKRGTSVIDLKDRKSVV